MAVFAGTTSGLFSVNGNCCEVELLSATAGVGALAPMLQPAASAARASRVNNVMFLEKYPFIAEPQAVRGSTAIEVKCNAHANKIIIFSISYSEPEGLRRVVFTASRVAVS
jgi:hypothetical protein